MKKVIYFVIRTFITPLLITFMAYTAPTFSSLRKNGISLLTVKQILNHIEVEVLSLEEANAFAQKNFLLTEEQWMSHEEETDVRQTLHRSKAALLRDLQTIGMIDVIAPPKKNMCMLLLWVLLKMMSFNG